MNTQLYKIAESFRRAIEHAQQDSNNKKYPYFQHFPTGTCGNTCYMLAKYLSGETKLNISIYYVEGYYYINGDFYTHAWLEILDNNSPHDLPECSYIIDITGDQFKDKEIFLYNDITVYVGHANDFYYKLLETKRHPYDYKNMPLEPELICCYKAILKHM